MVRILTSVALIALAVAVALRAGGVSGGPEARRKRIQALGKWPAIFVTGLTFGLTLTGMFVLATSPHLTGFYAGMSYSQILATDLIVAVLCNLAGLLFGRAMWNMQHALDEVLEPIRELKDAPAAEEQRPARNARGQHTTPEIEARAHQLMNERKAAIQHGRIAGVGAAVMIAGIGLLVALGSGSRQLGGGGFGIVAAGYFNYRVISSWFCARPRVVLLLRRFGGFDDQRFRVADALGEVCRGLSMPITVQDDSFKGAMSIGLQALERYVCLPLAFFGPLLILIAVPTPFVAFGPLVAIVIYAGLVAASYLLLRALLLRRSVLLPQRSNYRKVLTGFLRRLRGRASLYSGTRVIKLADDSWRDAIELCLKAVDCVVIDITDLNDNVAWEVKMAYQHVPAEAILLTWEVGQDADETPDLSVWSIPTDLSSKLTAIVPSTVVERSRRYPRPGRQDFLTSVLLELAWPIEIAYCLAAGLGEPRRLRVRTPC